MNDHSPSSRPIYTPMAEFDERPKAGTNDPYAKIPTIPGAPRLPTDTEIQTRTPDQDEANWEMIRTTLKSWSQDQSNFLKEAQQARIDFMRELNESITTRFAEFAKSTNDTISGIAAMLKFGQDETNTQLARLNEIVVGLRSATLSAVEAATSANRTANEIRKSSIPSGAHDKQTNAGYGSDSKIKI